jgi:DNA-binding NarL/FixJ family response regulator
MNIRVLIVDDEPLIRAGIKKIIETEPGLDVAGEAGDGLDAVDAALGAKPDVVLMDIRMPRVNGIEATREIAGRAGERVRVLMLTTFGSDEYVFESLRAGASGFLLKDAPPGELTAAIRIIARGDALLAPRVTRSVIEEFVRRAPSAPGPRSELAELTHRELEVLKLLTRGLSNAEIAQSLQVSQATVKTHVGRVLIKLGVRSRVQAVIYAYEAELVKPGHLQG